ncbi:MAG: class D sortase [Chloroflexota bacterium]
MARRNSKNLDGLTERELEEALYRKRHADRKNRLTRLKDEGRVVDVPPGPADFRTYTPINVNDEPAEPKSKWSGLFNRSLLMVEIAAAAGFIWIVFSLVSSVRELNTEIQNAQEVALANIEPVATPTLPPVIDLVLLPSGHKPPIEGQPIVFEEAGNIPSHLLPLVDAYVPPPAPTPGPSHPRQVEIAKISVNAPVFQGHEPEQLKKGVGHSIGTGLAGKPGNMVLSAHNDIYGEIFRNLDQLEFGDEVVVSTGQESYTYVVNSIDFVEPTAVEVMAPTDHSSLTLISCYPYLVNNQRIIIKADLKENFTFDDQS